VTTVLSDAMLQECSTSEATTRGVTVAVKAFFVPEQSDPRAARWFFAYRIRITNTGADTVQLISRHWIITDAQGSVEQVRGPGVVGKQPTLAQGESFEYTSFCPLPTPFGFMEGWYHFHTDAGDTFDAKVQRFDLSTPMPVN
jgi:ApaG protein